MHEFLSEPPAAGRVELREAGSGKNLLSERELEVLRLLAQGKSNPEIAKELFITRNTVQNHVSSILIKTNLGNRTEAALYAKEHGLIKGRVPTPLSQD
jgi:DNA-binding NarL/FixJ family response regulator